MKLSIIIIWISSLVRIIISRFCHKLGFWFLFFFKCVVDFLAIGVFKFCHYLSFVTHFFFLVSVTIWVHVITILVLDFLSEFVLWILSQYTFFWQTNFSFWVLSLLDFLIFWQISLCHKFSFLGFSQFELLSFATFCFFLVFSQFYFLSFVTSWVLEFCQYLSFGVLSQFDVLNFFLTVWFFLIFFL